MNLAPIARNARNIRNFFCSDADFWDRHLRPRPDVYFRVEYPSGCYGSDVSGLPGMNRDLSNLLKEWAFQPGQINARMITGEEGEPRVRVRLDLGIIQMLADG